MTKADIVKEIADKTGIGKIAVLASIESFLEVIINHMSQGEHIFLRGFGTFNVKKRAKKTGRNILKKTTIIIPEHYIPIFKPVKAFSEMIKKSVLVN